MVKLLYVPFRIVYVPAIFIVDNKRVLVLYNTYTLF